jgi:arginase
MNVSKKPVSIISFNSNLGLIGPAPSKEPGVKKLPEWLRNFEFFDLVDHHEEIGLEPPPYSMYLDPVSDMRNTDSIAAYAKQQALIIQDVISRKTLPWFSAAIAVYHWKRAGFKATGRLQAFFIDGHTDFMWPSLSSTHGAAGMDLAIVTGHGHENSVTFINWVLTSKNRTFGAWATGSSTSLRCSH